MVVKKDEKAEVQKRGKRYHTEEMQADRDGSTRKEGEHGDTQKRKKKTGMEERPNRRLQKLSLMPHAITLLVKSGNF